MSIKTGKVEFTKRVFREFAKDLSTSIPGHVVAFDPTRQIAQLQIGIVRTDTQGNVFTPSLLIECPVLFSGGGGFVFEHKLNVGDEGIIIFSQRCIDGWVNTGGVAQNPLMRFHDKSDAYFIPGLRSQPKKISDFQNDGIRMRDSSGNYVWLKDSGDLEIKAGNVDINSDSLKHNGVNVGSDHKHPITSGSSAPGPTGNPQ